MTKAIACSNGPSRSPTGIGSFDRLPMLLNQLAAAEVWRGELPAAASLIAEADDVCEATGARIPPYAALRMAAFTTAENPRPSRSSRPPSSRPPPAGRESP